MGEKIQVRAMCEQDLEAVMALEYAGFSTDRITRSRMRHWCLSGSAIVLVAESLPEKTMLGYGLVLLNKRTRVARLYSIVVDEAARGRGVARRLLAELERAAEQCQRRLMRLEVSKANAGAIRLYQHAGYRVWGEYPAYYQDGTDALRMEKPLD